MTRVRPWRVPTLKKWTSLEPLIFWGVCDAWMLEGEVGTSASMWYAKSDYKTIQHTEAATNQLLTLSARTRNKPKSSSIAHCVTILTWSTRRMAMQVSIRPVPAEIWPQDLHRESWRNPIQTPSAHPIATSPRPFGVSNAWLASTPQGNTDWSYWMAQSK